MKQIPPSLYPDDRGELLPGTARALQAAAAGKVGLAQTELFAALQTERLIVEAPVTQHSSGGCGSPQFRRVYSPYGAALAVYSSAEYLQRLAGEASRPVLVKPQRLALVALAEKAHIWLNPPQRWDNLSYKNLFWPGKGSANQPTIMLGGLALSALGSGDSWLPPWQDLEVSDWLDAAISKAGGAYQGRAPLPGGGLEVIVGVPSERDAATELISRICEELVKMESFNVRVSHLELSPRPLARGRV